MESFTTRKCKQGLILDMICGVGGSYNYRHTCDRLSGSETNSNFNKDKSPSKRSPFKPQVPPKPAHLQSPLTIGHNQTLITTVGNDQPPFVRKSLDQTPNLRPVQSFQDSHSSVKEIRRHFLNGESDVHCSPRRPPQEIQKLTGSPRLGSPSLGKRIIQSCNPQRGGGQSPTKLSPRNPSPLMGKAQSPSPVQRRMRSYSPAKNSKSWLGLHQVLYDKERQEKSAAKSCSVPDLVIYMDESRSPGENVQRCPLRPLQSPNCNGSPIFKAEQQMYHNRNEGNMLSISKELFPQHLTGMGDRNELDGVKKEGGTPTWRASRFSCSWTKEVAKDEHFSQECKEEPTEEEKGPSQPKAEEKSEQKLYQIASEILQTERAYVARLYLLDQVFFSRLTEEAGRGSFPLDVIRNIFSNVSSIYSFHSQFLLPDLENCICHWSESPALGKVLLQHAPFLRMYADYVKNFDQAMDLVRMWTERSSVFRNIIQEIQSQEMCGNLALEHHMLEPVQRVPRYEMLLKDYLRKLPEDNPDYDFAQKSLRSISMAASHSNSAIQKAESLKRLLAIYEMVGEEEVVNPTNEFLREGRLLKLAARNASAMERHLFLFNNFLMCCSPRFSLVGQRYTMRCRIGVDGMQVHQTTNEDHLYTFQISGKERTLELQASSEEDRDEWIKVIQEAINVFQKKNKTFKLASKEINGAEQQMEELGRRAPRWIRDNEVTLCMSCMEPFNALTRRRHHCRACGYVVCWRCSDYKVALEYDGNKLNKVCKACYTILNDQKSQQAEARKTTHQREAPLGLTDGVMSGFLQYGDNHVTWQRRWSVFTRTHPPVLCLYAAPMDLKPLLTISLLDCHIEVSPQELQGRPCFCLIQSKTTHTFSCDSAELRRTWLTALKTALMSRRSACSLTDSGPTPASHEEI
ncbi:FYVE, RhoGEF and PH domain-containing protein 4-like isoform X2 [Gouania willdenowi]|uniref:FYVE, RhoGEF and PH domain-containing protein 4-like isoform X2 n=1 Tax=Gouania willdenowi TaxID=441366 RepID=UPI0010551851|nr:FYVE, RhoGEF and PH domain-containing protein 4-like isoform X2 [Gouania willdenowi]